MTLNASHVSIPDGMISLKIKKKKKKFNIINLIIK